MLVIYFNVHQAIILNLHNIQIQSFVKILKEPFLAKRIFLKWAVPYINYWTSTFNYTAGFYILIVNLGKKRNK